MLYRSLQAIAGILLSSLFCPMGLTASPQDTHLESPSPITPMVFKTLAPGEAARAGVFDITHDANPWSEMLRYPIPDDVLKRHGLEQELLRHVCIIDGRCANTWVVAEPDLFTTVQDALPGATREQRSPPPLLSSVDVLWMWTRPGLMPVRAKKVEEMLQPFGSRDMCRFIRVEFNEDAIRPSCRRLGFRAESRNKRPPAHWRLLSSGQTLFQGSGEERIPVVWTVSALEKLEGHRTDPVVGNLEARLGKTPWPRAHWTKWEERWAEYLETDEGDVVAKVDVQKWVIDPRDLVPWGPNPRMYLCSAILHESTGPLMVPTIEGDSPYNMRLLVRADGRVWVIPPDSRTTMLDSVNIDAAVDINQDQMPDLVVLDWTQGEGYGAILLLLDDAGAFVVSSTGGYYCS